MSLDRRVTVMITGRHLLESLDLGFYRVAPASPARYESTNHKVFVENDGSSSIVSNDTNWM